MLRTVRLRLVPARRGYWNGVRLKPAYMGGWRVQAELMGCRRAPSPRHGSARHMAPPEEQGFEWLDGSAGRAAGPAAQREPRASRAATAGKVSPCRNSRKAPPPVEM